MDLDADVLDPNGAQHLQNLGERRPTLRSAMPATLHDLAQELWAVLRPRRTHAVVNSMERQKQPPEARVVVMKRILQLEE